MSTLSVISEKDLVYGRGGDRELRCDLYRPTKANSGGVLMIHGGGWRQGEREMMAEQVKALTSQGFTCMVPEYRFVQDAPWPACLHDVKAALRWLRMHCDQLGVDAQRISVLGNSAGGHLALMLAGTPKNPIFEGSGGNVGVTTQVAACIAVYPPVIFFGGRAKVPGGTPANALLGEHPSQEMIEAASPITYVHPNFPPTFFLHGTADKIVPHAASQRMHDALVRAGATSELHLYADQPHGWARRPEWAPPTMAEAGLFLTRYTIDTTTYAATE